MKTRLCLFAVFSLMVTSLAFAQDVKKARTIEDYQPRTLQELSTLLPETIRKAIEEQRANGDNNPLRIIVHHELMPSRVKAVYSETSRPLPDVKKKIISDWANRFAGMPEFYTAPFQTETLFSDGKQKYWLALRKDFPTQDIKNGARLELCVIKLGNVSIDTDDLEPVLLVEHVIQPGK